MGKTGIQWTDVTWNYFVGCSRKSPGCDNCYAFPTHDKRYVAWHKGRWPTTPKQYHRPFSTDYRNPATGPRQGIQVIADRLNDPYHWRKPRRVFVNSMSDVFHPDASSSDINDMWQVMFNVKRHTYQLLTKRPERMLEWTRTKAEATHCPMQAIWPEWIWPGTSVENQEYADLRIPYLLQLEAAVPYLSMEPLLGPVDLSAWLKLGWICEFCHKRVVQQHLPDGWEHVWQSNICDKCAPKVQELGGYSIVPGGAFASTPDPRPWKPGLKWVIIGGESGPRARPMSIEWAESLIEQCQSAGVAVFMKQTGTVFAKANGYKDRHGGDMSEWPEHLRVREFPKV